MIEYSVERVKYLGDFVLLIHFNDGTSQKINFKSFLFTSHHPDIRKYQDETLFLNYAITDGDLQWNDYELCFPIEDLYENQNIEVAPSFAA